MFILCLTVFKVKGLNGNVISLKWRNTVIESSMCCLCHATLGLFNNIYELLDYLVRWLNVCLIISLKNLWDKEILIYSKSHFSITFLSNQWSQPYMNQRRLRKWHSFLVSICTDFCHGSLGILQPSHSWLYL